MRWQTRGHFESVLGGQNPQRPAAAHELAVETETYEYELQVGFVEKLPYPSQFQLDPVIKEESIWLSGQHRRPSSQLMKRKNQPYS